jgi:hypothetical protein
MTDEQLATLIGGVSDWGASKNEGLSFKDDDFSGIEPGLAIAAIKKALTAAAQAARQEGELTGRISELDAITYGYEWSDPATVQEVIKDRLT